MPIALLLALTAQATAPLPIDGRWRSPGGNSIIEISACGAGRCGAVVWASAKARQDALKGTNQLIGAQILTGLVATGKGWRGKLFIPDRNMRVTAKLELVGESQLKVSGCAVGRSLCRASLWTRVEGPLPAQD